MTYIDKTDILIIAASEWQYKQAVDSYLFKNNHPKNFNSVNPEF